MHLSRAGWLHYRDALPSAPLKPGKGPIALRVRLDTGGGFDLTEQGTQKRLAAYLVRDPKQVPGVAKLGPDALTADAATFAARIRSRRGQVKGVLTDQEVLAGVGNAYSDEILHRAKLSPFAITDRLTDAQMAALYEATQVTLTDAVAQVGRSGGSQPQGGEAVRARGAQPHRLAVPGVRRADPGGLVRRFEPAVLSRMPDRGQAARRPPHVQAAPLSPVRSRRYPQGRVRAGRLPAHRGAGAVDGQAASRRSGRGGPVRAARRWSGWSRSVAPA